MATRSEKVTPARQPAPKRAAAPSPMQAALKQCLPLEKTLKDAWKLARWWTRRTTP